MKELLATYLDSLLRLDKSRDGQIGYPDRDDYKHGDAKKPITPDGFFGAQEKDFRYEKPIPQSTPKPVEKGQELEGYLFRRGERWIAKFAGDDREAMVSDVHKISETTEDGQKAKFYIKEQSKRIGIKARFDNEINEEKD